MQLSQERTNKILVVTGYVLVLGSLTGLILCRVLTLLNILSHEQLDSVTNDLSWLALTLSGATFWLQSITKREINDS
jgi:hypothetical protein